ncbi:MAG: Rid family detoxifying hydrolase [Coriobacteriales bacterium]|nr:Rid family detoxifying hydrolase [Coriobacteriales bacterium]
MDTVATLNAPQAIGPYSQATVLGNLVFASGQIPAVPETGELVTGTITDQTRQVIANLEAILSVAGSDLAHVLKSTCFLTNMGDFAEFNAEYALHFTGLPARECVEVTALPKGAHVEISVIAERP